MNNYSQYGEEIFLIEYFKNKSLGFLVEIGAADGINNSNSRKLIENGWKGLLVEPNKNNFIKLEKIYLNTDIILENCGCSYETKSTTFFIDQNDEYQQISTFNRDQVKFCKEAYSCEFLEQESNLIKTSELFEKHLIKNIDFLSIDTETYDLNVLKGIDFESVNIELICIEDNNVSDFLESKGYKELFRNIGNTFYKKIDKN